MKHIKLSLLFALLFLSFSTSAKVVNESRALQVASRLLGTATRTGSQPRMKVIATSRTLNLAYTRSVLHDDPAFFIVTPQSGHGFVIVSGDDSAYPFIGYSVTNDFPTSNLPSNLKYWLETKREEILSIRKDNLAPTPEITQAWQNPPRINTRSTKYQTALWNQSPYENTQCPLDNGKNCLTGCTSTAIAIVMKYHNYPQQGYGSTEAYTGSSGIFVPARNLSEHQYNWDKMPMILDDGTTNEQIFEVSQLMADIGAAIQANYGLTGTSAYYNVPKLIKHFSIDEETKYVPRDGFTDDQWANKLCDELEYFGPILYEGQDVSEGHAFVIEGYNTYNGFDINWGWGGAANGTYYLGQFNPNETSQYNDGQGAVFGFSAGQPNISTPQLILHEFYNNGNYDDEQVNLNFRIENTFDEDKVIYYYVSLYSKDGNFKKECYSGAEYIYSYSKRTITIQFPSPDDLLEVGDYYTLSYRYYDEPDKMRKDFYTKNAKGIQAIAYDPETIEEATQITFNETMRDITIKSKRMTEISIFDNQSGKKLGGDISSYTFKTRGNNTQDYKIVLTKRKERKEVIVSVK